MSKINFIILSFLIIAYSQAHAMSQIDAHAQTSVLTQVMGSFNLANDIKNNFLNLKEFDQTISEDEKLSKITDLLRSYQIAHEIFIYSKFSCNPINLSSEYLDEYCFCNTSLQEKFQAKADSLLGGNVLDLHKRFEYMRSVEYKTLLIPYRLVTG